MKILGLDGKEYKWNYKTKSKDTGSKLHKRARSLLKALYPFDMIYEEVFLPGTKTAKHKGLKADFYIPSQRIIVEVQGQQHFAFNSFHYENQLYFGKAKNRDRDKEIWCTINNIAYVGLKYDESDTEWTNRINQAHRRE